LTVTGSNPRTKVTNEISNRRTKHRAFGLAIDALCYAWLRGRRIVDAALTPLNVFAMLKDVQNVGVAKPAGLANEEGIY
jgi:hypothetical protein